MMKYIIILNFTTSDIKYYKYIVKYINKYNLDYFYELFDNYDIFIELFYLLPYNIASHHKNFKNIKESWCERNFDKSSRYFDEFDEFLVYGTIKTNYYILNGKIYHKNTLDDVSGDLFQIYNNLDKLYDKPKSYCRYKKEHIFTLITYMYEILCDNENYNKRIESYNINQSIKINNFELLKYFINGLILNNVYENRIKKFPRKDNNKYINIDKYIENPIICDRIDIIEYIVESCTNINFLGIDIGYTLSFAIKHNKVKIFEYLIDKYLYRYINYMGLLSTSTRENNFKFVKLLVDNYISIDDFIYDSIYTCDLDIIVYIIENVENININKLYINFINSKNFIISKYIEDNYKLDENLLSSNGNIKYIKNIGCINENILYYNSEEVCIDFFKNIELSEICKNDEFIKHCIYQNYYKLLMFIMNNVKNIKINDTKLCESRLAQFYEAKLIIHSNCENNTLEFIKYLLNNNYELDIIVIIEYSIIFGYLEILKYLYNKKLFLNNICRFISTSIENKNIEVFKYLITLKLHNNEHIDIFFKISINNNFEIIKYLVEKYKFLINNSFEIVNRFMDSLNYEKYIDVIKYFSDKGAHIYRCVIYKLCIYDRIDIVDYLLKIKIKSDEGIINELIESLSKVNQVNMIKYLLENYGNYIKPKCKALEIACGENNYYLGNILIKYIKPENKMIIKAYKNNYLDIVILLVENGIDFNLLKKYIKNKKIEINNYLYDIGLVI